MMKLYVNYNYIKKCKSRSESFLNLRISLSFVEYMFWNVMF